jgi:hypothetical protein
MSDILEKGGGSSLIAAALALAADGLPVFPCNGIKKPIVEHGFKNATCDPDIIREMFARPGAALIGMPTGRTSGRVVIDVDPRHGGDVWSLENQARLPPTLTHGTPGGGKHLVFRDPSEVEIRNSQGRLAPGIDVRGTGGYVIVPPSAGYTVKSNGKLADMPPWLIEACGKPEPPPTPPRPRRSPLNGDGTPYGLAALEGECAAICAAPFGMQEISLNNAALKIGSLVAAGQIDEGYALAELIDAGNSMASQNAREPWRRADVEEKVRRGLTDGMRTPRNVPRPDFADDGNDPEPPGAGKRKCTHIWRSKKDKGDEFPCTPTGKEFTHTDGRIYAEVVLDDGTISFAPKDELFEKPQPQPKPDPPKAEPPKAEPPKVDPPKVDPPKAEPPKVDPPKVDPPKVDPLSGWPEPDMAVLKLHRRDAPCLPLDIFGDKWARWIEGAAEAASAPVDYVVAPLLAAASSLIGHARWAQAKLTWVEPPHLWCASVGDSGDGKSPGADAIYRYVMPDLERRQNVGFPEKLLAARAAIEIAKAKHEHWKGQVKGALKDGLSPPQPPPPAPEEPAMPRLVLSDITHEKVAILLVRATLKGVLMHRDELADWLLGMTAYNDAARAFWNESFGGRRYCVDRVKHPEPIIIPRLAVAWHGGIQPSRLAEVMREADDGLLARFLYFWPEPALFHLTDKPPETEWAIDCLDRLRTLDLDAGDGDPRPVMVPLTEPAARYLEHFAQLLQAGKDSVAGLMRSAAGKTRGLTLRLSLILEYLRWCAKDQYSPPPTVIQEDALLAAAKFIAGYAMPMAERTYGDAACSWLDRNTATLARWIKKKRPDEVHVREMLRTFRLPGLTTAEAIHDACKALIEAGWLGPSPGRGGQQRGREAYPVSPRLKDALRRARP